MPKSTDIAAPVSSIDLQKTSEIAQPKSTILDPELAIAKKYKDLGGEDVLGPVVEKELNRIWILRTAHVFATIRALALLSGF